MLIRQNLSCSKQPEDPFQQRPVGLTHLRLQLTQTGADVDGNGEEQQREQLRLCSQLCLWPCFGGTEELPETCQQRSRLNPSGQRGAAIPAGSNGRFWWFLGQEFGNQAGKRHQDVNSVLTFHFLLLSVLQILITLMMKKGFNLNFNWFLKGLNSWWLLLKNKTVL